VRQGRGPGAPTPRRWPRPGLHRHSSTILLPLSDPYTSPKRQHSSLLSELHNCPAMGPSVDPLLDRLLPPTLVELSPARRKLLLISLLLLRTTPVVELLSTIQIPGRESAERRRERKRIEALTPLTTPVLEKESADLVRRPLSLSCPSRARQATPAVSLLT
jgi:hypothetical protein